MNCNHFCNEPFRCWTCTRQFYAWAQMRTHSRPRRDQERDVRPDFNAHVNVISPILVVQVGSEQG